MSLLAVDSGPMGLVVWNAKYFLSNMKEEDLRGHNVRYSIAKGGLLASNFLSRN